MTTDNFTPVVTRTIERGQWQYSVSTQIDGEPVNVTLPVGNWGYGEVIAAIIRSRYTDDEVQAIAINMQCIMANCCNCDDDKKAEYQQEYLALTEWRNKAKVAARAVIEAWSE